MVVNTINELVNFLDQVDIDARTLASIANDSPTSTSSGPGPGLVTTRLGTNVKNVQKILSDIENGLADGIRPSIKEEGVVVVESSPSLNFVGSTVTVTNVGGVATITVLDHSVNRIGNSADNQIAVWTGNGTIEGNNNFTFDGSTITVTANINPAVIINDSNDTATLRSTILNTGTPVAVIGTTTLHDTQIHTNNLPRLNITAGGLVGIGTPAPTKLLTLNAESPTVRFEDASASNFSEISNNNTSLVISADVANTVANTAIVFEVDAAERARISNTGIFDVTGSMTVDATFAGYALSATNGATGGGIYSYLNHADNVLEFLRLENNTKVVCSIFGNGTAFFSENLIVGAYVRAPQRVREQTGTSYSLTTSDTNVIVTMDNAAANTVNVDLVATTPYPVGHVTEIIQLGTGATTIQTPVGATLNGIADGAATITARYDVVKLIHIANNTWIITGEHGAVT
jgi:hypothetical protein